MRWVFQWWIGPDGPEQTLLEAPVHRVGELSGGDGSHWMASTCGCRWSEVIPSRKVLKIDGISLSKESPISDRIHQTGPHDEL